MASVKSIVARKAAKAAVQHTVHGTVTKAKRRPFRAVTLLSVGAVIGAVATFLATKGSGSSAAPPPPPPPPPPKPAATKPVPAPDPTPDKDDAPKPDPGAPEGASDDDAAA